MLNTNTTEKLMAEGGLPQTSPQIPDNSKFEFESVYDFFSPPDTPEFNQIMDPQYENMLRQHAQQINTYAPAAIGNLNTPTPTLASDTYNPTRQRTGYDLSTPDGINALLKDKSSVIKSNKPIIANPIAAGIRESSFDRYYKHPQFSKLGWHPYADNESFYNANSTWWDDFGRMSSQFGNLAKTGFVSSYRSIGDLFDSDSYFSGTDMESAAEFSDAMRIGNSTRGGFAGFSNNLALQLGYTTGIIGSIAVEELALFGAAAIQGGFNPVSDAALAGRTTFNLGRLGRSVANAFDVTRFASATRNMYNTLRSVDAAKDFYSTVKTGGKLVGQVFAPETYRAIKTLNSAANGAQNLTNMAKVSKTFGAFYRDLRSLNLALSESKMEGGMVYAQQLANNYDYYSEKNNGSPVTPEQMELITENASRAAYWTTVQNAPTIFFSNQLLLGNAFGSYNRSLARILNDNIGGLAGRVIRAKGFKEAGKIVTRPFADAGTGLKGFYNTIKAAGVRGSFQMGAHASLRYFAANLAEGIQEVTQEAISHGTKDYHLSILKDPASGGRNLLSASIASAVSSQWNARGFETFMSGFLMGGLAQGPQKLLFQGIPNLYQRTFEKEKFEEYKKNKEKYITDLVDSLNDAYEITANDPMSSIFDTNKVNLVAQKQASIDILQSMFDSSEFDFGDAKDYAKFQSIYTVLSSGKVSDFRSQFRDYLKMTNDELAEVFPASKADIKSGKVATRMQDMLNKIDELEDSYNKNKDKYRNPFNSSLYKPGTREYGEERIKEMSFEHARYLYMFTEDGFKRALERSKSIYDELASDPIVGKMAASDITVLLDEKSLAKEITTLVQEITLLDSKESKDIIEAKTNKLKGLQNLFNVLYGPENLNTKGVFDKRKIKKLEEAFQSYVQLLAKSNNTFADPDKIREALKKIIDYKKLGERAIAYSKSIEYMNNPDRFDEIRNRAYDFYKLIFKNRTEVFRESIKNYISKIEINQFLNELDKLNVIPDPKEVEEFMENGNIDVLQNFYSEAGIVDKNNNQDLYNQIQGLITIYKNSTAPFATEKTEEEDVGSDDEFTIDLGDSLDLNNIDIFGTEENINPFIKKLLQSKYNLYTGRQINLSKTPLSKEKWLNSDEAKNYISAYQALKEIWEKELKNEDASAEVDDKLMSDDGFEEWLNSKQSDFVVNQVFSALDINISDFIKTKTQTTTRNNNLNNIVDNTYSNVVIVEDKTLIEDPSSGSATPVSLFTVLNKNGQSISNSDIEAAGLKGTAFPTITKAREAAKKLDALLIDNTPFQFGDKEIFYGSKVYDKNGDVFVVISQFNDVQQNGTLMLLPVSQIKTATTLIERQKASRIVSELVFKNDYSLEGFDFTQVSENTSKLLDDEPVAVYAFKKPYETREDANLRLQTILSNLTPEERAGLILIISRNSDGGKATGKKYQTKDKEANPYINRVTEPFTVGITFGNRETATRINQILGEKGIGLSSDPDGVFAYIPTGSIQFVNKKNEVVNPVNLTEDFIKNTFLLYDGKIPVDVITSRFATQQAFVNELIDKAKAAGYENSEMINFSIPISELSGDFQLDLGSKVALPTPKKNKDDDTPLIPVSDLEYNTVDGVMVIVINNRLKDGTIYSTFDTNINDIEESKKVIAKVKSEISSSVRNSAEDPDKTQRYVLIVKSPTTGEYTAVPLKTDKLSDEEIKSLEKRLVDRAKETISENLVDGDPRQIKDRVFNQEFNKFFSYELYITTDKSGYNVDVFVSSNGSFGANVYDRKNKRKLTTVYLDSKNYLDNSRPLIKDLIAVLEKDQAVVANGIKISNVRKSFQEDATVETIVNNTKTPLQKSVRSNYKLRLSASGKTIETQKAVVASITAPSETKPTIEQTVESTSKASLSEVEATAENLIEKTNRVDELKKNILNGSGTIKEKKKLIENDPEIKRLNSEIEQITNKLNSANKIISKTFTEDDIADIDEFTIWAKNNLPDFITIDDISNLKDNLITNGIRVGAFVLSMNQIAGGMTIKGTLYTGAKSPYKYHEAFHGVFRSLLSTSQQNKLYKIAEAEVKRKLGNKFEEELEKFRNSANSYKAMSRKALEKEFYEEYMADEFEKFKKDPKSTKTDPAIKNLFNRLIEWIKSIFSKYNPNELQQLFKDIDSGKFKSASLINNRFTDSLATGVSFANKIIPFERFKNSEGVEAYQTLDNNTARNIISSITSRVIMLEQENRKSKFSIKEAVDSSVDLFKELYNSERDFYENMNLRGDQIQNLFNIEKAFSEFSDFIKEAVYDQLKYYEIKSRNIEEDLEDKTAQAGDRLKNTDQYDKDVTSIGGFSSLSSFLRRYIGTTPISEKDQFGNDYLIAPERDENGEIVPGTGEKLTITVDFATAYNGFLKAVKNLSDPIKILQRLYYFGNENPQTKAVVDRLFEDLGIEWAGQLEKGELPDYTEEVIKKFKTGVEVSVEELNQGVKRPLLFQAVLKGFENFKVDYLFIHRNHMGNVITYTASNRDDANSQVDRWGQAYIDKSKILTADKKVRDEALELLDEMKKQFLFINADNQGEPRMESLNDPILQERARNYAIGLETLLGIQLSPLFIEFSISKNLKERTEYQEALVSANIDENVFTSDDADQIKLVIASNSNLYGEDGNFIRLKRIALANSAFDENVGTSVFKNPNGDLVYAHQLPSFHLKQINALNDVSGKGEKIEQIRQSDEYLTRNYLLNSEAFKELSAEGRLKILRISGSKTGNIELDSNNLLKESLDLDSLSKDSKTYGDLKPKDFVEVLVNSYIRHVNPNTGLIKNGFVYSENKDGVVEKIALAPILIRVLESSNQGDMVDLPVIKAVEGNDATITNEFIDAIFNNVRAEFERIQKESNPETATQELHVGYNAIAKPNEATGTEEIIPVDVKSQDVDKARAFNFNKTGVLLKPLSQKKESSQVPVSAQPVVNKNIQDIINKSGREKGEYEVALVNGVQTFIDLSRMPETIKRGYTVFYSHYLKEGLIKRAGKKIVVPGFEDINLMLDQEDKIIIELSTGLSINTRSSKQSEIIKELEEIFKTKNIREVLEKSKKINANQPDVTISKLEPITQAPVTAEPAIQVAEEIENLPVDNIGYLDKLTEAARSLEFSGLTFEEAIKKANISEIELKAFLRAKLEEQFEYFMNENKNINSAFGSFIINGVTDKFGQPIVESLKLLNLKSQEQDSSVDVVNYNLKQIFLNDYLNTTAINQILLGDVAYSLKDSVDEIKRAKAQSAAYYSAASTVSAPEYGIFKPLQELSLFELTEPIVNATYNAGKVKNADAQLWMTTKAFRNFQYGFGKLTPAQAELFDRIERGADISAEDIFGTEESTGYASRQEMLNSQKLVYADGKTFVKMSAFPLLPQFTSLKDSKGNYTIPKPNKLALHNLRVKLEAFEKENDTVAVAAPRSALKMMQKNVSNIHTFTETTTPLRKDQSVTLDANYLGLQVINPSNKTIITDPTQVKTLVTSEQNDSTEVIMNGKKLTLGDVRAAYHKATRDRGNLNYINKRNLVFSFDIKYAMDELQKSVKKGEITADLYTYLRYAEASLASTGSSSYLLEFFSTDESGNQKYNLNNPVTYNKFLDLFMSYFSKSVFNEKIPGATISLASDYGVRVYRKVFSVDENGMPDKHEIITEAQYEAMANKPQILFNIDEGSYPGNDENLAGLEDAIKKSKSAGVVIIDRLRHNIKEYDSNGKATGQTYGEMLLPPHHKEVMKELQLKGKSIPDIVGKMFAIRIPSQDNHSTYNVKWIDFMPAAYGSTGIFARELIEISGADFDIDKVYTQFKEFYEKNGEFFEYGKAETEDNKYFDYVRYVNEKVKDSNSIYGEALYKYNGRGIGKDISITDSDLSTAKSRGLKQDSINALLVLGMPVTLAQYKTYKKKFGHEPYAAAMNNDILDYKVALIGNDHVTKRKPLFLDKNGKETTVNTGKPALNEKGEQRTAVAISYEAADLEVLTDLWDELKVELPEWAALSSEEGIDVDNLYGKLRMFANNKEGSRSIGAVVLPNLALSLLREYNIQVITKVADIKFNGKSFYNFGITHELNEDGSQGRRTQYILSALITAATDNAKERLLAKLGLNINALSVVATLTGLGVPIKTSILLVNQGFIKSQINYSSETIQKNIQREIYRIIKRSKLNSIPQLAPVTQNILSKGIKDPELLTPSEEISILKQFSNALKLNDSIRSMGDIINLSGGLGQGMEAIDKRNEAVKKLELDLSDEDFYKLKPKDMPAINVKPIFKSSTWHSGYLERFNEFQNILLPEVAISMNPFFKNIENLVVNQTDIPKIESRTLRIETQNKIRRDLISYLTIKSYIQNGLNNNPQSIANLTNNLIYDQDASENIISIINRLRDLDKEKNNYFLNSFIILEEAMNANNKTGLNIAGSNTFLNYNDSQKLDIQNGFISLYMDLRTRFDAMSIVHYMMVKDGMQIAYKSLIQAVAPIALSTYLNNINQVQKTLLSNNTNDFLKTFGLSQEDLQKDFISGYLTSSSSSFLIKTITYSKDEDSKTPGVISKDANSVPQKLIVDVYDNLRGFDDLSNAFLGQIQQDSILNSNLYKLENAGFDKKQDVKVKFNTYTELEFPLVIKEYTGDLYNKYRFFKLDKVESFDPNSKGNVGNRAEYSEIDLFGSRAQNAIGFIFGDRPTQNQLKNLINSSSDDNSLYNEYNDPYDEPYDIDYLDYGVSIPDDAMVEANEKGILVNGQNISQITDSNVEIELDEFTSGFDLSALENFTDTDTQISVESFFGDLDTGNVYNELTLWWDKNIEGSSDEAENNKKKLKEKSKDPTLKFKIQDYDDFVKEFEKSGFQNQLEFIEHFKNCYL